MKDNMPLLDGFGQDEEKKAGSTSPKLLPHFENPETDDQRLLNWQREYLLNGDEKALAKFMELAEKVALSEARKLMRGANGQKYKHIHCEEDIEEAAHAAALYLWERKLRRGEAFQTSVTGYLFLQVREKVGYRTKAFLSQEFCDIEETNRNKVIQGNAFEMRESEKETERELNRIYAENFTLCNEGDEAETYAAAFRRYVEINQN